MSSSWTVLKSFTRVKSGGLRAHNICLALLLPIPAKIMELASWVSRHHKTHTCTHSLFYGCLQTRAARNLARVASHHPSTLACISARLLSHQGAGCVPSAWQQEEATLPQVPAALAEGVPTPCGFQLRPFTPPSGNPEMFHRRSTRLK